MSTRTFVRLGVLIAALGGISWGCITSPPSEFGSTAVAKADKLGACPQGMIDDLEDHDSQILKVEDREGYWFTSADPEGSTIFPKGDFKPDPSGVNGSK